MAKSRGITSEEIRDLREAYEDMLKAILWMLDGARYLWQGEEKSLTAATVRAVITGNLCYQQSQFKYSRGFFR